MTSLVRQAGLNVANVREFGAFAPAQWYAALVAAPSSHLCAVSAAFFGRYLVDRLRMYDCWLLLQCDRLIGHTVALFS